MLRNRNDAPLPKEQDAYDHLPFSAAEFEPRGACALARVTA